MSDKKDPLELCQEHSHKLDRILVILEGTNGDDGLLHEHAKLRVAIFGNGKLGLAHRVGVMWRVHIWLACVASGAVGFIFRHALDSSIKH